MNFEEEQKSRTEQVEKILHKYLPREEGYQKTLIEAMNYSILAGGKRLRPLLMLESYHMFGGTGEVVEPFMAALEMIHNYSLVHDDLPAMDNDEYRRGRKTTWTVYGDGMAVLAGDGLLNLAFETTAGAFRFADSLETSRQIARANQILAQKAGIYGMIGGQCADIEAENAKESILEERLLFIHANKTAALIQAALMIGAVLAGADEEQIADMEKAAYDIGVAFQIRDDILDVTGTTEVLGKPVGSDEKNSKTTYVTLNGLERSGAEVERLSKEAMEILERLRSGRKAEDTFLTQLVRTLISREK